MYVIMLDKHLPAYGDWPVSASANSLAAIREVDSHDDWPDYLPRARYTMHWVEPKALTNRRTGAQESGGIYRAKQNY